MHIQKFPGARPIGKPNGWEPDLDGDCATIYVADSVDTLTGYNMMHSVYRLSDDEIEALRNGGLLRLSIMGYSHPVFQLGVLSPELSESIQAESAPEGDLGGVIHGE